MKFGKMWQISIAVAFVFGFAASQDIIPSHQDGNETLGSWIEANFYNSSSYDAFFAFSHHSHHKEDETCNMSTPYPVYELNKVFPALMASIPMEYCDEHPAEAVVNFNCMTTGDDNFYEVDFYNRTAVSHMTKGAGWGFFVHGFLGDCFSDYPLEILRVWSNSGVPMNVCCVNWHRWAMCNYYVDATKYVYMVGDYLAQVMSYLMSEYQISKNDIIPVGHSFGAHIVGYAAKKFVGPDQLPLCLGLDPAGWGYTLPILVDASRRLAPTDCGTVKTIITDEKALGTNYTLGNVNIIANGGDRQPMCNHIGFPCCHYSAVVFFIESIRPGQTESFPITSKDGSTKDYWTLFANDIPGDYDLTSGPCYPYSLASQPVPIQNNHIHQGVNGEIICEHCIVINNSSLVF